MEIPWTDNVSKNNWKRQSVNANNKRTNTGIFGTYDEKSPSVRAAAADSSTWNRKKNIFTEECKNVVYKTVGMYRAPVNKVRIVMTIVNI